MPQRLRPMPDSFREDVRTMTQKQLMREYRCGCEVMRRWLDEINFHRGRGPHRRPVAQYDAGNGTRIAVFPSLTAAAKAIYGNSGYIGRCAKGNCATAYGYRWKYCEGGREVCE